jgi:hypothetical protein
VVLGHCSIEIGGGVRKRGIMSDFEGDKDIER